MDLVLQKTQGIVLKSIKYSETSIIAKVYTEKFGLQSYIVNGVRSLKAKNKASLLQPMSLLEMVVYNKANKNLQRIAEFKQSYIYTTLLFDISKSSIGTFLLEVVYKSVREEEANSGLFNFIFEGFRLLDIKRDGIINFHLFFMLHLTEYLGFFPRGEYTEATPFFNLKEGVFEPYQSSHEDIMEQSLSEITSKFLQSGMDDFNTIEVNYLQRTRLLSYFIRFYNLHLDNFIKINSLDILKQVLN